ncbi:melanocortin-2 receptor accessory protein isoform X2 [Manis pentadactyla]|nr:melanocortin-2 receptor accessory protein isoform X2 [Manis pentadactyla]
MAHRPNASALDYSYEYYLDYLDLLPVDEKKLKANKHAVVIAFWVSLAALVALLFLFLLCMSCSGSAQTRTPRRGQPTVPPGGWASAPAPRPGVAQIAGTLARTQAAGPGWQRDRPRAEHGETPTPFALRHGNGPAGGATSGDRLRSRAPPALPPPPADL